VARELYLLSLLAGWAGVLFLDWRLRLGIRSRRLLAVIAITVPLFLIFDLLGSLGGWFQSSAPRNTVIVPPGIPLEEPVLLAFLCLLSLVLWQLARRLLGAGR
jgi:lycopene cyclase domain-containing protein